jgi:hypothetical protein
MWRRRKAKGPDRTHLSFVLTQAPVAVDLAATLDAYKRRFPAAPPADPAEEDGGIVRIAASDGKTCSFIAPMPAAVPDQEADNAAEQSLCALRPGGFVLAPHRGHFVVSTRASGLPIVESLKRHTLVVAAVAEAHEAVGIYEGNARATHATAFYLDVAATEDVPLMLWTGISLVSEQPERLSILTLGMGQFGLPNLLVESPRGIADEALGFTFDVLSYILHRGAAIGAGETVGRTESEKLPVRYVPSPVDPGASVASVELPA